MSNDPIQRVLDLLFKMSQEDGDIGHAVWTESITAIKRLQLDALKYREEDWVNTVNKTRTKPATIIEISVVINEIHDIIKYKDFVFINTALQSKIHTATASSEMLIAVMRSLYSSRCLLPYWNAFFDQVLVELTLRNKGEESLLDGLKD